MAQEQKEIKGHAVLFFPGVTECFYNVHIELLDSWTLGSPRAVCWAVTLSPLLCQTKFEPLHEVHRRHNSGAPHQQRRWLGLQRGGTSIHQLVWHQQPTTQCQQKWKKLLETSGGNMCLTPTTHHQWQHCGVCEKHLIPGGAYNRWADMAYQHRLPSQESTATPPLPLDNDESRHPHFCPHHLLQECHWEHPHQQPLQSGTAAALLQTRRLYNGCFGQQRRSPEQQNQPFRTYTHPTATREPSLSSKTPPTQHMTCSPSVHPVSSTAARGARLPDSTTAFSHRPSDYPTHSRPFNEHNNL